MDRTATTAYASLPRRGFAYAIDALALGAIATPFTRRITDDRTRRRFLIAVLAGMLGAVYHVVLEGHSGQTLGKRFLGIAAVGEDGRPCTYRAARIRTGYRAVDWLPAGYALGIASIVRSPRLRRWGDRAAGTVVVRTGGSAIDPADATDPTGVERPESRGVIRP